MFNYQRSTNLSAHRWLLALVVLLSASCEPKKDQPEVVAIPTTSSSRGSSNDEILTSDRELSIGGLVHSIRPWPNLSEETYSSSDWEHIIGVALRLQAEDDGNVEFALEEYVIHFATAFDPDADPVREWSKVFLLVRVMFDVSEDELEMKSGVPGPTGFGGFIWAPISGGKAVPYTDAKSVPYTMSLPVQWRSGRPRLTAARAGYKGGRYEAGKEFAYFFGKYKYRSDLKRALSNVGGGNP